MKHTGAVSEHCLYLKFYLEDEVRNETCGRQSSICSGGIVLGLIQTEIDQINYSTSVLGEPGYSAGAIVLSVAL